ncbi:MAG: DUF2092 domain-containing protein [Betaproteobacteria bacterium]|nr:DUF2092 domain-containing protein [Betaproteobacteria bacterium]
MHAIDRASHGGGDARRDSVCPAVLGGGPASGHRPAGNEATQGVDRLPREPEAVQRRDAQFARSRAHVGTEDPVRSPRAPVRAAAQQAARGPRRRPGRAGLLFRRQVADDLQSRREILRHGRGSRNARGDAGFREDQARHRGAGGDLVYGNAYDILMTDVTQGFVVGKAVVEGVRCDHLAFRAPHVDWQIWIQEGKEPLPRKLVITTRDQANAPQFSVVVTKWNLRPTFTPQTFGFRAPSGAKQVEFMPLAKR